MINGCISFLIILIVNTFLHAQVFGSRQDLGLVEYDPIDEASGIAASRKNNNVLWLHNDSGDLSRIYAMNTGGEHLGVYNISGIIAARDWEDIAAGPGPLSGENYIYIGDIGDNNAVYNLKYIHRVLEPVVSNQQSPIETTLSDVETITYQYSDGNRDGETLMVDPSTKDIYVVSKRETNVHVYRIPYPQSTSETIIINSVATLDISGGESPPQSWTVGGDISNSGLEILIKTGSTIYYWSRSAGQDLWEAFNNNPVTVTYIEEPKGEAVTWESNATGYYTVSEEIEGVAAHLYFYSRLDNPLPVELSSFNAYQEGSEIVLKWITESEINNFGFEIEKKSVSHDWHTIGFVNGHGNTSSSIEYTFVDRNISIIPDIYYRLKQLNYDGTFEYSAIIQASAKQPMKFSLNQNYPNPFNAITNFEFQIKNFEFVTFSIYNLLGQKVATPVDKKLPAGHYNVQWDASGVPSGAYIYTLETSTGLKKSRRLILLK